MTHSTDYADRQGDYIVTWSGRRFYPIDPRVEDIDIEDIAHALSNICRYTGHVRRFYSVAQHSVLCARMAAPEHALEALLHDGSEAYIADIARPVKPYLPDYKAIEAGIERAIARRFQLPFPMSPEVKAIDTRMLVTEGPQVMSERAERWWEAPHYPPPFDLVIEPWTPEQARLAFLVTFEKLTSARGRLAT